MRSKAERCMVCKVSHNGLAQLTDGSHNTFHAVLQSFRTCYSVISLWWQCVSAACFGKCQCMDVTSYPFPHFFFVPFPFEDNYGEILEWAYAFPKKKGLKNVGVFDTEVETKTNKRKDGDATSRMSWATSSEQL